MKEGSEYLDKKLRRKVGVCICVCVAAETKLFGGCGIKAIDTVFFFLFFFRI